MLYGISVIKRSFNINYLQQAIIGVFDTLDNITILNTKKVSCEKGYQILHLYVRDDCTANVMLREITNSELINKLKREHFYNISLDWILDIPHKDNFNELYFDLNILSILEADIRNLSSIKKVVRIDASQFTTIRKNQKENKS